MTHPLENKDRPRKYPFINMKIDDYTILDTIEGRFNCSQCLRSRKFFCYNCYIPVGNLGEIIPKVRIPLKIDIIKHKKEIDGKSTAIHAAVLAPNQIQIYTYPDIPDYSQEEGVVLIFPSVESVTVAQLFERNVRLCKENNFGYPKGHNVGTLLKRRVDEIVEEIQESTDEHLGRIYTYDNLPIKKAVFIDSTWNQSRGIYKDERVKSLKPVILQNRCSQFWRHQKGSPRWYLATLEAVHQFLLEVHVNAWGLNKHYRGLDNLEICESFYKTARLVEDTEDNVDPLAPYNGQYDNLMYFFANMYDLIHKYYDHHELKSYRRPI
ncbi:tRNA-uridine aminocarboxypropyltransferase 1 [Musca vetustissima]|uniref:tRNA-uridine aminocarboxypropyltransferase 1 n=1 Tax=Musca vetustissima TaxID=27455 RepID=UPI002AB7E5E1|nr:tRNA-uridine aminocarboxypropyltransferase 1 [Musca vetustissima]